MIHFRCSSCGKQYSMAETRTGDVFTCSCKQMLRVPRRSGGYARYRTWGDLCIELLVYGLGGGVLGFCLALLILAPMGVGIRRFWVLIVALTLAGFLIGGLGGERGINWIGRKIREREQG